MRSGIESSTEAERLSGESTFEISSDPEISTPLARPRLENQFSRVVSFNKGDEGVPLLGPRLRRSQHSQSRLSLSDITSFLYHLSPRSGQSGPPTPKSASNQI